jgi:DNA polymerase III subunit delta
MVAIKPADIDAFAARPDPARPIVLVCGPDAGLVRERVELLVKSAVDNPDDPFSLARIDGDMLADQPSRLVEEAHTIPLFGGRRAVWVKAGARNYAGAVEALIAAPPGTDCRVVIEAGDLKKTAPVRALCEKSPAAAVLACYADTDRDLARLIDEEMRAAGLTIAPDARTLLVSLIGGDRRASRNEVQKLALYAGKCGRVEVDDILAVTADASALALDALVDAALAGKPADVEIHFGKARAAGTNPGAIVSAALRQTIQLHKARLGVDAGGNIERAMYSFVPPVHFRRKAAVEAALSAWTAPRLEKVIAQLAEAALDSRRRAALAEAIVERTVLSIAQQARKRG